MITFNMAPAGNQVSSSFLLGFKGNREASSPWLHGFGSGFRV